MRFLLFAALALIVACPAMADEGNVVNIETLSLKPGANEVEHLAPDGRKGTIIKAQRNNGNAQEYSVFIVMLGDKIVGVAEGNSFQDVIKDYPHNVTDAVKSVRFARSRIDEQPTTLLITATREIKPDHSLSDPAVAVFDVYQLVSNGPLGTTGDFFERVSETRSKEKYCNADLALFKKFGFALPDPYEGPNQIDGCL